jgi:hypothetical protein
MRSGISIAGFSDRWPLAYSIMALILAIFVSAHVPITQSVLDPFQEGEYSSLGTFDHLQQKFPRQSLIHGGMDIVPARIAATLCDGSHQIVCIRAENEIVQFASVATFLMLAWVVFQFASNGALISLVPAILIVILYNGRAVTVLDAQQGAPSVRDLFVLIGLLLISCICLRGHTRSSTGEIIPLFLLGSAACLGLFWCYNRGLVLIVCSGMFTIGYGAIRRSIRPLVLVAAGASAASVLLVVFGGGLKIFAETISDIHYWSQSQGLWKSPLYIVEWIPFTLLILISAYSVGRAANSLLENKCHEILLLTLVLASAIAMYIIESMNRPDQWNIRWCIWPITLILIMSTGRYDGDSQGSRRSGLARENLSNGLVLAISCLCISPYAFPGTFQTISAGFRENILMMSRPLPSDRTLAGAERTRVADVIAARGGCTFAANDDAIIYLLSRIPPCSRFSLGDYVAPNAQASVIGELTAGQPGVILLDSGEWWSNVDGRNFQARAPALASWILEHYPVKTVIGTEVLLTKVPIDPIKIPPK